MNVNRLYAAGSLQAIIIACGPMIAFHNNMFVSYTHCMCR